ncbi:MAG TPA: L,D-transpeptidase [Anaerolineae bacterium]|nr:L,D-transpeptidase [Anaerolineae bacterium]
MSRRDVNRRNLFKLAGAALAGAALPQPFTAVTASELPPEDQTAAAFVPRRRGRVLTSSVTIWDQIETPHTAVKRVGRDGVILLGEERVVPGTGNAYNNLWYRTRGGWVHSGWIQPMEFHERPVIYREAGPNGFWVEVIEPKTSAHQGPSLQTPKDYDYIYGTVYLVSDVAVDERGRVWYRTEDEYSDKELGIAPTQHWVQAHHVRRLHESEFMAIRPEVAEKRILVDLQAQMLTCFEGDREVLQTKVATGAAFTQIDGSVADFGTPKGEHQAILKMPSRHMRAIEAERNTDAWFDLPGVPWNTFFTLDGIAIHGTYWHNDFGVVRSHGCVNVPISVARFIYFWTFPTAPYTDAFVRGDVRGMSSTQIEVA